MQKKYNRNEGMACGVTITLAFGREVVVVYSVEIEKSVSYNRRFRSVTFFLSLVCTGLIFPLMAASI